MCGICGILRKDGSVADRRRLEAASDLLIHRGPDDAGCMTDGPVGLAARRLAVIDLHTGHQPIAYDNDNLWIVCNGEIYNYIELRSELEQQGYRFATRTDTEVILALYHRDGVDCVNALRGMFAFALWDKRKRRLLLARDRIGKKPLVYAETGTFLAFASELRSLFAWPELSREIEPSAVDEYLSLQYIPAPGTIYRAVHKLLPGHVLVHEAGRSEIRRYWDLPTEAPAPSIDAEEAARLVVLKVRESVRLRLVSDVPVGAFLSGGVDSSIIVAVMSSLSDTPVRTFSVGFEEAGFSELGYAREVANRYGCIHTELVVKPRMADVLPTLAWHYGEPYADTSALPLYYLAKEASRSVTVALTGDGGDESFGGYVRYFAMKAARIYQRAPALLRRALESAAGAMPEHDAPLGRGWKIRRFLETAARGEEAWRYLRTFDAFSGEQRLDLYSREFRARLSSRDFARAYLESAFAAAPHGDLVNTLAHVDLKTFVPEDLMVKTDIATMANSLESRSPFLDHELVELMARMPGDWKLRGLRGYKWLLKRAFKDEVPSSIRTRAKMGFGIPQGSWLRGPLRGYWEDHVLADTALARGYFDPQRLRHTWAEHQRGARDHGYGLWALLMLELWHQTCL